MQAYKITFKVNRTAYHWHRYAENREALESQLKEIYAKEYDGKAETLAIMPVRWSDVRKEFAFDPAGK